jgi:hypothetical protein
MKRALARAQEEPQKNTGRKLMYRSQPPSKRKQETGRQHRRSAEEEELRYYFS